MKQKFCVGLVKVKKKFSHFRVKVLKSLRKVFFHVYSLISVKISLISLQTHHAYHQKPTSELMAAIQLGIGQSVGGLSSKPERDMLMQDFGVVEVVFFPG